MLFILGLIAFLQMTVLPGAVIIHYLRIHPESKLQRIVYTFGFSLVTNYILVYLLTAVEIYKSPVVYLVLAIEMGLLMGAWIRAGKKTGFSLNIHDIFNSIRLFFKSHNFLYQGLFFLSIVIIALFFKIWLSRFMEVFYFNDAVLSWNRWATDWFHNRFPLDTWFYPQLLPANWSIAYQVMRNPDIQFVPRNIMGLFPIATALLFLDLGLRKRNAAYFIGLIVYGVMIAYLFTPAFITDGYMEIPVAFFAFLSVYVLSQMNSRKEWTIHHALISVTFASAAAETKQAGLYILIFILVWNIVLFIKNRAAFSAKTILKTAGAIVLIILVIVMSWYFNRIYNITYGFEKAGIKTVTQDIHKGRTYLERLDYGYRRILDANGNKTNIVPWLYIGGLLLLCSLLGRQSRYVTLFIVIPFILIWGFFFSYDYRNITLAVPFAAFSMGLGTHALTGLFGKKINSVLVGERVGADPRVCPPSNGSGAPMGAPLRKLILMALVFFIPVLLILNFTAFKQDRILTNQLTQLRKIGLPELNDSLYRYYHKNGLEGKVFSKYNYFRFLPVFRDYWAENRTGAGVSYFLEDFNVTDIDMLRQIKKKIRAGEYRIVLRFNQFRLIKIRNHPHPSIKS